MVCPEVADKEKKGRKEIIEENIHKVKKSMNLQTERAQVSSKINKQTKLPELQDTAW